MKKKNLRSKQWFDDPKDPGMTAMYLERYLNYGLTREELQSGNPIIGIAQSGSDLSPCNRHFLSLSKRIKDGIRRAGGIPMEFPTHPIQETGKKPTAMLDRNLSYLSLVEVLYGYPLDGVILTTGCDKTTPAALMAAATVNIPAIVLSGGPMLDGNYKGRLAGSGTIIWEARRLHAKGEINYEEFMDMAAASAPSPGHCNTMGTASSMNSVAEALGMSLPGCAVIPAPYREREQMSFETGLRIVKMVNEDLTPSKIMTKKAFENAVVVASAIGASSNCTTHLIAIAKHMGVKFDLSNWQKLGHKIPLLANCQPAGEHLMEGFYRAGGIPAIMKELVKHKIGHKNNIMIMGLSYGGASLLRATLDKRMQSPKPKSILSYGTYYSIHTALDFFISGTIQYKGKTYEIKPHEWGPIVMFYNFIHTIDTPYDNIKIQNILKYRIQDNDKEVEIEINKLENDNEKQFIQNILDGKLTKEMKKMAEDMVNNNLELLEYLSPEQWINSIDNKVFIMHGANDSMVPFTESTYLHDNLKDSTLLVSFLYEHREISTDRGIFFKLKEFVKLINFNAKYIRYNL